ncbi:MAG: NAD-dependent epimerase/dehydratase family protein, partial [Pseudomonadota bacterium]
RDALICSSTSSTNPKVPVAKKNETEHWSDRAHQYEQKKYTSAAKTVMEAAAMAFAEAHNMRLSIFLPTLMLGPAVLPEHSEKGFQGMLHRMMRGEPSRHARVPNDSASMIHVDDLAALFFAAYENSTAQGRYFGVYDSWHFQDIYAELAKLLPDTPMPQPLEDAPARPTGFDFTRRDSLGVSLRDIPTILAQTIESMR